jgi:hypothetical protein
MSDVLGIAKVIEKMADPVIALLQKVAGPAAEEVGLTLKDAVHVYRVRRAYRLAEKFATFCSRTRVQPRQVPLRILLPVLDAASVEDDETLHTMWANILAAAATPGAKPKPYPAFIETLKQLSREEAVFFNAVYDDLDRRRDEYMRLSLAEQANSTFPEPPDGYELVYTYLSANGYVEQAGSPEEAHNWYELEVDVAFENLMRLGLLGERSEPGTAAAPIKRLFSANEKADLNAKLEAMAITSVFNRRRTSTTTFGDLFASVCRHPEELVPTKTEKPQKDVPSD